MIGRIHIPGAQVHFPGEPGLPPEHAGTVEAAAKEVRVQGLDLHVLLVPLATDPPLSGRYAFPAQACLHAKPVAGRRAGQVRAAFGAGYRGRAVQRPGNPLPPGMQIKAAVNCLQGAGHVQRRSLFGQVDSQPGNIDDACGAAGQFC